MAMTKNIKKAAKVGGVLITGFAGTFAFLLLTGWIGLIGIFMALAMGMWFSGWWWESHLKRPVLTSTPFVSILIPAWKSEGHIKKTLLSVKKITWPNKEIIVVNDSRDKTNAICKSMGIKCMQSKKRNGKSVSLNKAAKLAKGDILFFIDSDTVVQPDCMEKILPRFSDQRTAAVMPRYVAANKSFVARLANLEHAFLHSLFKTHMAFGSLISFRGCAVAIRKDVFFEQGGWPETLIEDTDFSARLVHSGYKITYEPSAVVQTMEPDSFRELGRQRHRWGKGAAFSWFHHKKFYAKNPQFLIQFLPYIFLLLAILAFVSFNLAYVLPAAVFYLAYTYSIKEVLLFIGILIVPIFSNMFASVTAGAATHLAILSAPARRDLVLIFPYIFVYLPVVMFYYFKGIFSGVRDRRKGRPELDLKSW